MVLLGSLRIVAKKKIAKTAKKPNSIEKQKASEKYLTRFLIDSFAYLWYNIIYQLER